MGYGCTRTFQRDFELGRLKYRVTKAGSHYYDLREVDALQGEKHAGSYERVLGVINGSARMFSNEQLMGLLAAVECVVEQRKRGLREVMEHNGERSS